MEVILDCTGIATPAQLHSRLAEVLPLPEYYGHNLDALYDCLTSLSRPTVLVLENFHSLERFSRGFHRVFAEAAARNPAFSFRLSGNPGANIDSPPQMC